MSHGLELSTSSVVPALLPSSSATIAIPPGDVGGMLNSRVLSLPLSSPESESLSCPTVETEIPASAPRPFDYVPLLPAEPEQEGVLPSDAGLSSKVPPASPKDNSDTTPAIS